MSVRWNRAAAFALVAGAGIAGWWPVLGSGLLWAAPIAVVGVPGRRAARCRARTGAALLASWIPASLLLAGLPGVPCARGSSAPRGRRSATARVAIVAARGGADRRRSVGARRRAARRSASRGAVAALLATAVPPHGPALVVAAAPDPRRRPAREHAAQRRLARRRAAGRACCGRRAAALAIALPAAAVVSLVAVAGAQAFGPHDRWLSFDGSPRQPHVLAAGPDAELRPLTSAAGPARRCSRSRSPEPALWRMQVLEDWDGRGWGFVRDAGPLPEPRGGEVTTKVRIVGLSNRLIAAPGRIDVGRRRQRTSESSRGESWRFTERARPQGDTYTVTSRGRARHRRRAGAGPDPERRDVRPLHALLAAARRRPRRAARPPARRHLPAGWPEPVGRRDPLARRLSAGTDEPARGRAPRRGLPRPAGASATRPTSTTRAGPAARVPVQDARRVLPALRGRRRAAAAAGRRADPRRQRVRDRQAHRRETYAVRDEDAHAWIEVYFPGYGWVPFNPTPASAEAEVAPEIDVFAAASRAAAGRVRALVGRGRCSARSLVGAAVVRPPAPRRRIALGEVLARPDGRARRPVHDAHRAAPAAWRRSARPSPRWPIRPSGRASPPTARRSRRPRRAGLAGAGA